MVLRSPRISSQALQCSEFPLKVPEFTWENVDKFVNNGGLEKGGDGNVFKLLEGTALERTGYDGLVIVFSKSLKLPMSRSAE